MITHQGTVKLGEFDIPCYILEDGMQVVSEQALDHIVAQWEGRPETPASSGRASIALHDGPSVVYAVPATELLELCNSYLMAKQLDELEPHQGKIAHWAEEFVAACADTGMENIIAQAARRKN